MKTTLLPLIFIALMVVSVSAHASEPWQEPEDFRGLKWGASIKEMRAKFPDVKPMRSSKYGDRIKNFFTLSSYSIGDAKVGFSFGFLDEKFSYMYISFNSKDFLTIRTAFHAKYGAPHKSSVQELRTGFNVRYQNELEDWSGPNIRISLRKYSGRIAEGRAVLSTHAFDQERLRVRKQQREDAATDL